MSDRFADLRAILADVRTRWTRRAFLRAWTLGAATAAAIFHKFRRVAAVPPRAPALNANSAIAFGATVNTLAAGTAAA